jgi:hypothetical protein
VLAVLVIAQIDAAGLERLGEVHGHDRTLLAPRAQQGRPTIVARAEGMRSTGSGSSAALGIVALRPGVPREAHLNCGRSTGTPFCGG